MASNVNSMTEQIPYYFLRHMVRPGITGWAQIRNGYAVSREEVTEKMRYDLYYIKHMSFWFDLRILLDTVKVVLSGVGDVTSNSRPGCIHVRPSKSRQLRKVEMTGVEYLFWGCLLLMAHTYFFYPCLLFIAYSLEQVRRDWQLSHQSS